MGDVDVTELRRLFAKKTGGEWFIEENDDWWELYAVNAHPELAQPVINPRGEMHPWQIARAALEKRRSNMGDYYDTLRCTICGCPLKERPQDGCVEGNCSERPLLRKKPMAEVARNNERIRLRLAAELAAQEIEYAAAIVEHPVAEPSALFLRRVASDLRAAITKREPEAG